MDEWGPSHVNNQDRCLQFSLMPAELIAVGIGDLAEKFGSERIWSFLAGITESDVSDSPLANFIKELLTFKDVDSLVAALTCGQTISRYSKLYKLLAGLILSEYRQRMSSRFIATVFLSYTLFYHEHVSIQPLKPRVPRRPVRNSQCTPCLTHCESLSWSEFHCLNKKVEIHQKAVVVWSSWNKYKNSANNHFVPYPTLWGSSVNFKVLLFRQNRLKFTLCENSSWSEFHGRNMLKPELFPMFIVWIPLEINITFKKIISVTFLNSPRAWRTTATRPSAMAYPSKVKPFHSAWTLTSIDAYTLYFIVECSSSD